MAYQSEEEQLEALKRWWQENGRSVIAGVVIAIVGLFGWKYWGDYQTKQARAASDEYQTVVALVEQGDEAASARTDKLVAEYAGSPYAALAQMQLAQALVNDQAYAEAAERYRWVKDNAGQKPFQHLARLSLARTLLAQEAYDEALAVLGEASDTGAYASQYDELKGDVHLAKGDSEAARQAYEQALVDEALTSSRRGVIDLKLRSVNGGES